MTQILHIVGSPKGERSFSSDIAGVFLATYRERHPDHAIRTINVFDDHVPRFGRDAATRKFARYFDEPVTPEGEVAWAEVEEVIAAFDTADKILLSCPMWNYSIPWALKLYLDNLVQPGLTFSYDRETMQHVGLLRNRPLQLILTRSSTMAGDYVDFQLPYLRFIFDAIGIRDTRVIVASKTTQPGVAARTAYIRSFDAAARDAANIF